MKKLVVVLVVFGVIAAAVLLGFSKVLSKGIVAGVETYGPDVTKTTVALDRFDLSAFSGSGVVSGFVVGNPEGFTAEHAIKLDHFELKLDPLSVISDKVVIEKIIIDGPEIVYETNSSFKTNIGQILKNVEEFTGATEESDEIEETSEAKKVEIGLFRLSNTKVTVVNPLLSKPLTLALPEIELSDLGKGEDGITLAEVSKIVLGSINKETIAAVSKNGGDLGKQFEDAGKNAKENVGNLLKGFKKSVESK